MHTTAQPGSCLPGAASGELFLYSEVIISLFPKQADAGKYDLEMTRTCKALSVHRGCSASSALLA